MIQDAKSEAAVSPIIGTILLVAIAVILALIILIVVMGFSGDTNEKKVGMNAKAASGNDATLLLYGGASIPELVKLEMIDQGSPNGTYITFWNISDDGDAFVGIPYLVEDVAKPEKAMDVYDTRINVRGTFSDGTNLILLVQPMTFYNVRNKKHLDIRDYLTIIAGGQDITQNLGEQQTWLSIPMVATLSPDITETFGVATYLATEAEDGSWTFTGSGVIAKSNVITGVNAGWRTIIKAAEQKPDGTAYKWTRPVGVSAWSGEVTGYSSTYYSGTSDRESGWVIDITIDVPLNDGTSQRLRGLWYIR